MEINNPQIVDILVRLRQCVDNAYVVHIEHGDIVRGIHMCIVLSNDIRTLLDFIESVEGIKE